MEVSADVHVPSFAVAHILSPCFVVPQSQWMSANGSACHLKSRWISTKLPDAIRSIDQKVYLPCLFLSRGPFHNPAPSGTEANLQRAQAQGSSSRSSSSIRHRRRSSQLHVRRGAFLETSAEGVSAKNAETPIVARVRENNEQSDAARM